MQQLKSPIENIVWIDPNELTANDYNPNVVFTAEMRLLEFSIKRQGWIQPILVTKDNIIIDGFHRFTIAKRNDWLVPCAILEITDIERRLLTIRINRAKGAHIAIKMSDIIKGLLKDGVTEAQIAEEIGGDIDEVKLLAMEDIFEKFDLNNHQYSKSWIPKPPKQKKNALKKSI